MDKRAIIFLITLVVVFYAVHEWFSPSPSAPPTTTKTEVTEPPPVVKKTKDIYPEEEFYVLENNYQQLVFSTLGGALAEINLPLKSKENQDSVIRPISYDKIMQKDFPHNDHFPASSYTIVKAGQAQKIEEGAVGGYYPLLRRNIKSPSGLTAIRVPPQLYSLGVVSEDTDEKPVVYKVRRIESDLIEFESTQSNRRIVKTFSIPKNASDVPYCLDLQIKVEGDARGLWLTSGVPEVEIISGSSTPTIQYRMTRNQKNHVELLDLPKTSVALTSIQPDWVCNSNGFLGLIMDPQTEIGSGFSTDRIPGEMDPTRLTLIDSQYNLYPADKYPGYEVRLPLKSGQAMQFRVFAGPFENGILKKVDASFAAMGENPDYLAAQSFHGWFAFISEPFAKFLFILMKFFYFITHSWGISIILLTVALRIILYPLNAWSIKSTSRMQQIAPQVSAIQEKYKKDPKRAQMEIMGLYREKKVNPLSGCIPLLIQMPFLIGMFDLLKSTFELRGATFIPHWIDNLTAPDVLFSWNYPIPFFGTNFHLLPVLLGAVMYMQQKFASPIPKDQKQLSDQQKQQKMMGNIMTIVFTVMFYHFPSGLNIYWLSSMLLSILQQWLMNKRMAKQNLHIT